MLDDLYAQSGMLFRFQYIGALRFGHLLSSHLRQEFAVSKYLRSHLSLSSFLDIIQALLRHGSRQSIPIQVNA